MTATRADKMSPNSENEKTAISWYTTLMKRDLDAFEVLYTPDAVIDMVYHFSGQKPTLEGLPEIMDDFRRMFKNRKDHVFTIKSLVSSASGDCIVVESNGVSLVGETGKIYDNDYVMIFHLDESARIRRLRFYCNPIRAQEAFTGILFGPGISPQADR